MDREQAFSKTIVSKVVFPIVLNGNGTSFGGDHDRLLFSKFDVVGGLPNPPQKVLLVQGGQNGNERNQALDFKEAYYMPNLIIRNYIDFILRSWSK